MANSGQQYGDVVTRTVTMDSDLTDKEMFAVTLDATDDNNVNLAAAATGFPFVLLDGGVGTASVDYTGSIALSGRVKVKLGGTVAPGDKLVSNGDGKWITSVVDKDHFGAIALQIGAANDVIEAWVVQGLISAT